MNHRRKGAEFQLSHVFQLHTLNLNLNHIHEMRSFGALPFRHSLRFKIIVFSLPKHRLYGCLKSTLTHINALL